MYYVREKEGINENLKKEGKMRISILISIYTVHFNFRILTQVVAEKSLTEKNVHMYYVREKEGINENLKKKAK